MVDGSLLVTLGELATARRAAIVVEDRWADAFRLTYVRRRRRRSCRRAAQSEHATVPIAFRENRQLAQEWAYRFLGAAAAYADEEAIEL